MKTFTPKPEQVRAAELLTVAMARHTLIAEKVTAYEARILQQLQIRPAPEFIELADYKEGQVITKGSDAYLMGEADAARFHEARIKAMHEAKLSPAAPFDCPKLESEALLRKAQAHLIDTMADTIGLTAIARKRMTVGDTNKVCDLMLKLLGPFVRNATEVLDSLSAPVN